MHNCSLFYRSHWRSLTDIEVPSMVHTISYACAKWSCSIWEMRLIGWERALGNWESKFSISRCENDFYISKKLSQTEWRKAVIIFDNWAGFECVSERLTCYIWESFSRRERSADRHDIVDASISDNWHTTFSCEFPSDYFVTIWLTHHWLCIRTCRGQSGTICIIESQEHWCTIIERRDSREEYLYWRSFWSRHQFYCWFWYEDVGNCDEQYPDEQWRSNHRFMHLATVFQCTKKLFKSNISHLFPLDYGSISLLKYFWFSYFCEELVKNAFKNTLFSYTFSPIFLSNSLWKK